MRARAHVLDEYSYLFVGLCSSKITYKFAFSSLVLWPDEASDFYFHSRRYKIFEFYIIFRFPAILSGLFAMNYVLTLLQTLAITFSRISKLRHCCFH